MTYDSLWIEDSHSPRLGKKLRNTFHSWKKQTQGVRPSISTKSISSPFGFQHVCHMDTKTVFGVERSLHIADKSTVNKFLPNVNNFFQTSAEVEEEEEEEEEAGTGFDDKDEYSPTTLDPGPLKAFSFNKTTPSKLSSALSSTSLATKQNHRRTTSSLSSLSARNSSTFTRMSYLSANSNDCASPLEFKRPMLPAIPQDSELNKVMEEDDDDADYTYKFQTIPIAPKPPSVITELKLEDIPCDSDNESVDIQLEKCHLALEKLDTEFVPLANESLNERDTGVMEIIFRHSKMILRDSNNQNGDIINLLEQLDPELTKELQEVEEEETDFFGDLGLDDSLCDNLSEMDIINMSSYASSIDA